MSIIDHLSSVHLLSACYLSFHLSVFYLTIICTVRQCTCPCSFLFIIYPSVYTVCLSSILCPFFLRFYLHVFCVSLYIYIYYLTDGVTGCSTRTVCSDHHFKAHYKRFCVCVEFADTELSNFQYRIQVFCFLHSNPHCPCH